MFLNVIFITIFPGCSTNSESHYTKNRNKNCNSTDFSSNCRNDISIEKPAETKQPLRSILKRKKIQDAITKEDNEAFKFSNPIKDANHTLHVSFAEKTKLSIP